jgi:sigma-B regulation protein RsbU (phosphoserine phosphatase)
MDAPVPSDKRLDLLRDDVDAAAALHYGFLPEGFSSDDVEIAVKMVPHWKIGGDYCSILPIDRKRVLVCMCDVSGHGIASALLAARVNTFVLTCAFRRPEPWTLAETLNEFLCERLPFMGMFVTLFALLLDFERGELTYAGAGHPPAIHYEAKEGEIRLLEPRATPLGVRHPLPTKCCSEPRALADGDRLLLYTDGLLESRNAAGEEFGVERLSSFVEVHRDLEVGAFGDRLFAAVHEHADGKIDDDLLALTIRIK